MMSRSQTNLEGRRFKSCPRNQHFKHGASAPRFSCAGCSIEAAIGCFKLGAGFVLRVPAASPAVNGLATSNPASGSRIDSPQLVSAFWSRLRRRRKDAPRVLGSGHRSKSSLTVENPPLESRLSRLYSTTSGIPAAVCPEHQALPQRQRARVLLVRDQRSGRLGVLSPARVAVRSLRASTSRGIRRPAPCQSRPSLLANHPWRGGRLRRRDTKPPGALQDVASEASLETGIS